MSREVRVKELTHKDLVRKAGVWLRYRERCAVVCTELTTGVSETPDAIGFKTMGKSTLIECKMSRSDFHADKSKVCRMYPECGMGDSRYFMAPIGVLKQDDMPENWGLIEVTPSASSHHSSSAKVVKESGIFVADKRKEMQFMIYAMRRLQVSMCVYVNTY